MSDIVLPSQDETATGDERGDLAERPTTLRGGEIAYIDWGKPNGKPLYEEFENLLAKNFDVSKFRYYKKPTPSSPMPQDIEQAVVESDPDAAILAIADCGSCNSSAVIDNITLETAGIPTVQIITDEFVELNQQIRNGHGYDTLPIVPVPHPTRFLDREEVQSMAQEILGDVHELLTNSDEFEQ